jgi:hypothetical protein
MKYATIEDFMTSFPRPLLPTVQGEPYYQTIHATRKCLQANSRAIGTHLGGGTLGHLGLIISDASYAMIAPTKDACKILGQHHRPPGGHHPTRTPGLVATKLVALTRVSLVNSQNPATKRRPLERITWEVVRPTGNDVQGRQL